MVGADGAPYGFVVESVNVSVLLYVPVRRASPAPMACLKATVTGSLLTGPGQVSRVVGLAEPPTGAERGAGAGRARRRRAQRLRQRERAVDEAAGAASVGVGDRQRRVAGGADHVRGRARVVLARRRRA